VTTALPLTLGAPATRALTNAGVRSLDDLTRWSESDLAALHGVGPKAVDVLRRALADRHLTLQGDDRGSPGTQAVDDYLAGVAPAQRAALVAVRNTLRSILPHATECVKYGMPAFTLEGKGVAGYAAFRDHCGYFPMSGSVLGAAGDAVAGYATTKGGLRFGVEQRLPVGLVRRLVKLRLAEIAAVDNGRRSEYYDDGQLKAVGQMRDGQLHGRWKWFRQDGTLMRTGQFSNGKQTGTWTSWDAAADPTKVTRF
jgi:uncharacterized protein YdhG (YjbR/CyaY superfamily)